MVLVEYGTYVSFCWEFVESQLVRIWLLVFLVLLWSKPGPCVQKAMTNGFFNPEWMANNYVCNLQIRALLNLFF